MDPMIDSDDKDGRPQRSQTLVRGLEIMDAVAFSLASVLVLLRWLEARDRSLEIS